MLSTAILPEFKFGSMILVGRGIYRIIQPGDPNIDIQELILKREDIWSTREDALRYLRKAWPTKTWDSRVLERFVVCRGMQSRT